MAGYLALGGPLVGAQRRFAVRTRSRPVLRGVLPDATQLALPHSSGSGVLPRGTIDTGCCVSTIIFEGPCSH